MFIFGCFLDLCFCFQKVDCDVLVWISQSLSWWCLPVFLDLEVYVLCLIWEVLSHYFSKYFSSPTLFLLSFWDSVDMNVRYFIIVPHRSGGSDSAQFLFFFFFSFFILHLISLCCSGWVISTVLQVVWFFPLSSPSCYWAHPLNF